MPKIKVMPSILAADPGRLAEACRSCEEAGAEGVHIDIMDGHFVPNLTMGPATVSMAKRARKDPAFHLSVHLMITNPAEMAQPFLDAGADTLLIHVEAEGDIASVLKKIRDAGVRPGITVNPATSAKALEPYYDLVDEVLIMTVHPGFGGQSFKEEVLEKISVVRTAVPKMDIAVDGGIDNDTAVRTVEHGANILLAGSSLFNAPQLAQAVETMRNLAEQAIPSA